MDGKQDTFEDNIFLMNDNENIERRSSNEGESFFDTVVGHIEDILVDSEFQNLHQGFMEQYWHCFESCDENKLCYMNIFNEYIAVIEKYIEHKLTLKIPHFSMDRFITMLEAHRYELEGEIFEILFTFTDFIAFKEMFLDYKAAKEGNVADLSSGISVTPLNKMQLDYM